MSDQTVYVLVIIAASTCIASVAYITKNIRKGNCCFNLCSCEQATKTSNNDQKELADVLNKNIGIAMAASGLPSNQILSPKTNSNNNNRNNINEEV